MKASDAFAKFLAVHEIEYCFELVGGMITHLLDSLAQGGQHSIVSMHHEQAAAFAAEGVARATKGANLAVALGTSGPGATNLITGIGSCWLDSVPCLFITGQVNTNELKKSTGVRQQGFQELDIVPIVRSITKYAIQIDDVTQLLPELHRALSEAKTGRKGPVLLDIPNDIQRMEIPEEIVESWLAKPLLNEPYDHKVLSDGELNSLKDFCRSARRPLICIGGGARWSESLELWLADLVENGTPYVSTLMGHEQVKVSALYHNMIGAYGNREANWAIQNCDLLIVIGARLDVRQTGANSKDFARHANIVQVDIDPAQLDNRVKVDLKLCVDTDVFLEQFRICSDTFPKLDPQWNIELTALRQKYDVDEYMDWDISPSKIFSNLNQVMRGCAVNYVCDVGNHQMWAAQGLRLGENQSVHYSGGMGAMGFALPAAIGVALSTQTKTVVITGDGSLQVNIQELDTINRLGLDFVIIVLNNSSLGMVKNFQDMYFDGRNQSTQIGYSNPPFAKLALTYGIEALCVNDLEQLEKSFSRMSQSSSPFLIEILMDGATECRPRLAYGGKLDEQFPYLDCEQKD